MKIKTLLGIVSVLVMISCGASKNKPTQAQVNALEKLINDRHFIIESDWAYPQPTMAMQRVMNSGLMLPGNNAANISLIGNYNFLKIKGDSITSHLPYFGERQMQVDYGGGDSSIKFEGTMENYTVKKNKNGYYISFNAKSHNEQFGVSINITAGLKTNMVLNGSGRSSIQYSGLANSISKKSKK